MKSFLVALLSVFVIAAPAADPQLQENCDGPMTTTVTPTKAPSAALSNTVMPALAVAAFATLSIFRVYMERRTSFATYYGNTFADGQKMEKNSSRIGGLASAPISTAAWDHEDNKPRMVANSEPQFISKYKTGVASTQQRGANKIVIPGDISKPTFLRKAQAFLNHELHAASIYPSVWFNPTNSDLFIQNFKTYEPILSDIKREYDLVIEAQRNDLSQFEIVKSKLSIMEFKMQKEIEKVMHDANLMIQDLVRDNESVQEKLLAKTQELMLMTKKNESLIQEQKRKAELKPAESPEMIELKNLAQEYANYERRTRDLLDAKSDQVVELIAAKQKAVQENADLQLTISNMSKMLDEYKSRNINGMIRELGGLKEKLSTMSEEKRMMYEELERNYKNSKQSALKPLNSQLPNWEYIQSQFSSNIKEYWTLARDMDSNDAIIKLIRELQKAKSTIKTDIRQPGSEQYKTTKNSVSVENNVVQVHDQYFPPKGTDTSIPKYLRSKTKVLNRHLTKENCLLLIKDIWEAKTIHDSTIKQTTLDEFLYLYLKKRFGNQGIICEWGYNLTEACQKFKDTSADCQIFTSILNGEILESSYYILHSTIEKLKNLFYQNDMDANHNNAKGFLDRAIIMRILNQFWPYKSKQQLYTLETALINDQPGTNVIYRFLFESESESTFTETLKTQHLQSRSDYLQELENILKRISRDENLSVFEATKAFNEIDSSKRPEDVDKLVALGFGIKTIDLKPRLMTPKKKFIQNIKHLPLIKGNGMDQLLIKLK
ncbi:Translin-associated factor X-interacting protein 1 [Boothiomyces sp. JEL0838]|nr:Translin-associated factor X-interacting protein 1 [Boothiomyces sp. JEL0838]